MAESGLTHERVQREALTYQPSKVAWATAEFLAEPPPLASRIFVYLLAISIVAGAIYGRFSEVAISIEAKGALTTEQALLPMRTSGTFRVARLNVRENQQVRKGDVLLVSEDQISPENFELVAKQVLALKSLLTKDKGGDCAGCEADFRRWAEESFQIAGKSDIRSKLANVQSQTRELATFEGQIANFESVTASTRRQIAVAEFKLKEIRRRKAESILAQQVEQLTNETVSGKAQIAERRQGIQTQIQQARNRLEVTLGQIMTDVEQYRADNSLVAPIDGVVTGLRVSGTGQIIPASQEILSLVPSSSFLVAELNVANKDISEVRAGMPVKVKLDALPEREFGSVEGKILTVPANVSGNETSYKVTVQLSKQSLSKGGAQYPFRLGMTLTGLVVTRYESLLKVGIRKLFNLKDDLIRD